MLLQVSAQEVVPSGPSKLGSPEEVHWQRGAVPIKELAQNIRGAAGYVLNRDQHCRSPKGGKSMA